MKKVNLYESLEEMKRVFESFNLTIHQHKLIINEHEYIPIWVVEFDETELLIRALNRDLVPVFITVQFQDSNSYYTVHRSDLIDYDIVQ